MRYFDVSQLVGGFSAQLRPVSCCATLSERLACSEVCSSCNRWLGFSEEGYVVQAPSPPFFRLCEPSSQERAQAIAAHIYARPTPFSPAPQPPQDCLVARPVPQSSLTQGAFRPRAVSGKSRFVIKITVTVHREDLATRCHQCKTLVRFFHKI